MYKDKIICPYCKYPCEGMEDVVGVDGEYGHDYNVKEERLCHNCKKTFIVEKIVASRYKTSAKSKDL